MRNENCTEDAQVTNSEMPAKINGHIASTRQKCLTYDLDEFWFSTNSITNVLSLSNEADKYRITMGTSSEQAMIVYFSK